MINLPIVNFYEHGTYLTMHHGHTAMFGTYGMLSVALLLFLLARPGRQGSLEGWPAETIVLGAQRRVVYHGFCHPAAGRGHAGMDLF